MTDDTKRAAFEALLDDLWDLAFASDRLCGQKEYVENAAATKAVRDQLVAMLAATTAPTDEREIVLPELLYDHYTAAEMQAYARAAVLADRARGSGS